MCLFAACASTTSIRSVPDGAKVYINGEYVGNTPYQHSDRRVVGSRLSVQLKKEGYKDFEADIYRTEDADVGAIVGGIFFIFPFLWTMGYKPVHTYEMETGLQSKKLQLGGGARPLACMKMLQ